MTAIESMLERTMDAHRQPRESGVDSPTLDIEILDAAAFNNLKASDESIKTILASISECSRVLGVTAVFTTLKDSGEIETWNPRAG